MRLAIVFGGQSFEHEISIVSAIAIKNLLKNLKVFIFLDQDRRFYLIDSKDMRADFFSKAKFKKNKELFIKNGGFFVKNFLGEKKIDFDIIINMIHGLDGEDGKIASLLEFYSIKYIGPSKEACLFSFDKYLTKIYASSIGVKTLDYKLLNKNDKRENFFDFPIIVKPLRLGSSIGISVVNDLTEFDYALDVAFEFDDDIIIEPFINNIKEYNLAGCRLEELFFSKVEEPLKKGFLDFDNKYLDFKRSESIKKANISKALEDSLKENFSKVYNQIFNGSLIRCDFFVLNDEVYLNEINPIPGSLANYLFEDFSFIVEKLCEFITIKKSVNIDYKYINEINSSKGK